MADQSHATQTLLTEHFRWTPLSLLDDIINSMNALLYHAVSAVEKGLMSAAPGSLGFKSTTTTGDEQEASGVAKNEIENGVHQLETLLEAAVDKNFDLLELYTLRNILSVPTDVAPWIRLGHYEGLDFETPSDVSLEEINQQRHKLRETHKLRRALRQEHERNEAVLKLLRDMLPQKNGAENDSSPFAFLTSAPAAQTLGINGISTSQPLKTTAAFVLSQLSSLRGVLDFLRPRLASQEWAADHPARRSDVDDTRSAYVEGQVRRHMTSTRGLELDENGAPLDSEGSGALGRRVSAQEVRDLENVVALLNGEK